MADLPELQLIDERAARQFVAAMMDAIDVAAEAGLPRDRMLSAMRQMQDHVTRVGADGTRILFRDVLMATAIVADLSEADLIGRSSKRAVARARQVACFVGSDLCTMSQSEIARRLYRDSTSVNFAIGAVTKRFVAGCATTQEMVYAVRTRAVEIAKRRVPGGGDARR